MSPGWDREIRELHEFFDAWFCGDLPNHDDAFERFRAVLDPGFSMVTPQGHVLTCIQVLAGVRNGHGARPGRIWIEEPVLLFDSASIVVARYQEWQQEAADTTGRLSTVVFERDGATPNGLRWLSVHETWLDGDRSARR